MFAGHHYWLNIIQDLPANEEGPHDTQLRIALRDDALSEDSLRAVPFTTAACGPWKNAVRSGTKRGSSVAKHSLEVKRRGLFADQRLKGPIKQKRGSPDSSFREEPEVHPEQHQPKRAAQGQMSSEQLNHEVAAAVSVDQAAAGGVAPLLDRMHAAPVITLATNQCKSCHASFQTRVATSCYCPGCEMDWDAQLEWWDAASQNDDLDVSEPPAKIRRTNPKASVATKGTAPTATSKAADTAQTAKAAKSTTKKKKSAPQKAVGGQGFENKKKVAAALLEGDAVQGNWGGASQWQFGVVQSIVWDKNPPHDNEGGKQWAYTIQWDEPGDDTNHDGSAGLWYLNGQTWTMYSLRVPTRNQLKKRSAVQ